ncbi:MAG: DsbA family protein [Solirubrobacteraceae bacterium]
MRGLPDTAGRHPGGCFYFDLALAECYLAAERVLQVARAPLEWCPVLARELQLEDSGETRTRIERRAAELGLQPVRWPTGHPVDSTPAMLAATYAKSIGRAVPFAQAAFRQSFAGGHSLADTSYVLLAAAACEMHPRAVLRALDSANVADKLADSTREARIRGVHRLPAVTVGDRVFAGERALEEAASALRLSRPARGPQATAGNASWPLGTASREIPA